MRKSPSGRSLNGEVSKLHHSASPRPHDASGTGSDTRRMSATQPSCRSPALDAAADAPDAVSIGDGNHDASRGNGRCEAKSVGVVVIDSNEKQTNDNDAVVGGDEARTLGFDSTVGYRCPSPAAAISPNAPSNVQGLAENRASAAAFAAIDSDAKTDQTASNDAGANRTPIEPAEDSATAVVRNTSAAGVDVKETLPTTAGTKMPNEEATSKSQGMHSLETTEAPQCRSTSTPAVSSNLFASKAFNPFPKQYASAQRRRTMNGVRLGMYTAPPPDGGKPSTLKSR
jgi:hypothetical protein